VETQIQIATKYVSGGEVGGLNAGESEALGYRDFRNSQFSPLGI
jgi:hypothetical protein